MNAELEHDEVKYAGEIKHKKKYFRRTKGHVLREYRLKLGNKEYSSQPSGRFIVTGKKCRRMRERLCNRLVKKNKIVDHIIPTEKFGNVKNACFKTAVFHKKSPRINHQNHDQNENKKLQNTREFSQTNYPKRDLDPNFPKENLAAQIPKSFAFRNCADPKIISLSKLHPNLYLGNTASVLDLADTFKIKIVIDLAGKIFETRKFKKNDDISCCTIDCEETDGKSSGCNCVMCSCKAYRIMYDDTYEISYQTFKRIIYKCINLLDDVLEENKVLVICDKGVNRSSSVVSAYGILKKNMTFSEVCDYIDTEKLSKYPTWNNLTNFRFRNFLKALQSDRSVILQN